MSETSDSLQRRGGWSPGMVGAAVVAVALLYVLSPLPIAFGLTKLETVRPGWFETLQQPLEVFFMPLTWLYDNVPAVEKFYDWYLQPVN